MLYLSNLDEIFEGIGETTNADGAESLNFNYFYRLKLLKTSFNFNDLAQIKARKNVCG